MTVRLTVPLLLALGGFGCNPEPPSETQQPEPASQPDIVLVVLDTVRPDHLSCYGYARKTSPNLDALCEQSTVYTNAYSSSAWTLPSHASLFTGLDPIRHRTHHEHRELDSDFETLAEVLSSAGYRTVAILANAMLNTTRKLDQGFSVYIEAWRKKYDKHPKLFPNFVLDREMPWDDTDDPMFRAAMKQLRPGIDENAYFQFKQQVRQRAPGEPLFLFVNLIGVHSPYNSSGPFYGTFIRNPELTLDENSWGEYYADKIEFQAGQLDHFVDLYDAEILHVDYVLGRMIEDLKAAGMWDDTLFIVTSDHGENLGEHGHLSHVFSLHETLTRIPLVVHQPGHFPAGARIEASALLVDLYPTILAAAGIGPSAHAVDGRALPRREGAAGRELIMEYYYPWENIRFLNKLFAGDVPGIERWERRLRVVIDGDLKLIWASDGKHELYDLHRDPHESRNLIDDRGHAAARDALLARLERFVEEGGGDGPIPRWDPEHPDTLAPHGMDPETIEQLKELGYL